MSPRGRRTGSGARVLRAPAPAKGTIVKALRGADAVAEAMRQVNPGVVAAYPITPQTDVVERFSEFVADGEVGTEFVTVESEHSAMSACIGAAAAGCRVMTATSANGLALMWEMLYIAASYRAPIVMAVANRALSGPINIHCDHSDSMGARDSGWIQIYSSTVEEVYDNVIQAVRIGESKDVRLPVMVMFDGFIISHLLERVRVLPDKKVQSFIGPPRPVYSLLDIDHPLTYGPLDLFDYYFEHKRQQVDAMEYAEKAITDVGKEYGQVSGRLYGYYEAHELDDAEVAVVALGSTASTIKGLIPEIRDERIKGGLLKVRLFRPFPTRDVVRRLSATKAVAVLDRSASFGADGGPLYLEVSNALGRAGAKTKVTNYIYGLGGRDISHEHIMRVYQDLTRMARGRLKPGTRYLGVRE
jgi:pyruvate ferredoxin oxidoreductase alpha subunit